MIDRQVPPALSGVKIVVWDLDETLWTGTLDAGDAVVAGPMLNLIAPLGAAGVVSSVCSNNDPRAAERMLRAQGVWDLLMFPQIGWRPKTAMIADLLDVARARPDDVLLVDDNARERAAVAATCAIRCVDPAELGHLDVARLPVTDPGRDRLERYRVLERKSAARRGAGDKVSRTDFLRSSEIVVADTDPRPSAARVAELSQRSNQLNVTGSRLTTEEVEWIARRPDVVSRALWVSDRFGNYGLAGYYALDRRRVVLEHFFFSCRLLHMGVEAWVFHRLGDPAVPGITAERARALRAERPDWIRAVERKPEVPADVGSPREPAGGATLWLGGCDLQVLSAYLPTGERTPDRWEVLGERDGVQQYAHSSLLTLELVRSGRTDVLDQVPWTANWSAATFDPAFATVVLSPWVDYASMTYEHRRTGVRIPSFVHLTAASAEEEWRHWWGPPDGRAEFLRDHVARGPLSPEEIAGRIADLAAALGPGRRLVVLNAPEVARRHCYADGRRQTDRHIEVNRAVDDVVPTLSNVALLDVRETVRTTADLAAPDDPVMFHYDRRAYRELAVRLSGLLAD